MAKNDLIFQKIISNEKFADAYNITATKYQNLDSGRRALQPEVKAVAEIVHDLNIQID